MFLEAEKKTICAVVLAVIMLAGQAVGEADVEKLQGQVDLLIEALASVRLENEFLRSKLAESGGAEVDAVSIKPAIVSAGSAGRVIVDVSPDLMMLVLDAGRKQGVSPGMRYLVMRGGGPIAEVCVVDVRDSIAGAAIVWGDEDVFPVAGDRAAPKLAMN